MIGIRHVLNTAFLAGTLVGIIEGHDGEVLDVGSTYIIKIGVEERAELVSSDESLDVVNYENLEGTVYVTE